MARNYLGALGGTLGGILGGGTSQTHGPGPDPYAMLHQWQGHDRGMANLLSMACAPLRWHDGRR